MSAERKRHRAQHVRSSRKVTVDYKLLCPISNNNVWMSVTVDIRLAPAVQALPDNKDNPVLFLTY